MLTAREYDMYKEKLCRTSFYKAKGKRQKAKGGLLTAISPSPLALRQRMQFLLIPFKLYV